LQKNQHPNSLISNPFRVKSKVIMPRFNDLSIEKWRESEVWTDSLWIIPERDKTGKHNGFYHGNFVPQIPRQLILRYTKKNEIVFDPFLGSGTTAYEAESLNRNLIGVEIQKKLVDYIGKNIEATNNFFHLIVGDSVKKETFEKVKEVLGNHKKKNVQLAILHPPYADIIKFSSLKGDLSNTKSLKEFLDNFSVVLKNTIEILEGGRYLAIVIGDAYKAGEWIPLGFYCMDEAQKLGLVLKSVIVKNMAGNRAKQNKEAIWRYRALTSDYYIFKHEYILIFKK
jgi:DNA modification methylase